MNSLQSNSVKIIPTEGDTQSWSASINVPLSDSSYALVIRNFNADVKLESIYAANTQSKVVIFKLIRVLPDDLTYVNPGLVYEFDSVEIEKDITNVVISGSAVPVFSSCLKGDVSVPTLNLKLLPGYDYLLHVDNLNASGAVDFNYAFNWRVL